MSVTRYFDAIRSWPDRAIIQDVWIERVIREPVRELVQADGRIRRWAPVPAMQMRYLRLLQLEDGAPVRNAPFDRGFVA